MADGDSERICRVCPEGEAGGALFCPCRCKGSIKWVHQHCLVLWISRSRSLQCEMCSARFKLTRVYCGGGAQPLAWTTVLGYYYDRCGAVLGWLLRIAVWLLFWLYIGPTAVGFTARLCLTPPVQVLQGFHHISTGHFRKWVLGLVVLNGLRLGRLGWMLWTGWYQKAVVSWTTGGDGAAEGALNPTGTDGEADDPQLGAGAFDQPPRPLPGFDTPPGPSADGHHRVFCSPVGFGLDPSAAAAAGSSSSLYADPHPLDAEALPQTLALLQRKQARRSMYADALRDFLSLRQSLDRMRAHAGDACSCSHCTGGSPRDTASSGCEGRGSCSRAHAAGAATPAPSPGPSKDLGTLPGPGGA